MKYEKLITQKNILITGGAGFVGSNLARTLYKNNNTIYVLDNYFTGSKKNHIEGVNYINAETSKIFWTATRPSTCPNTK